MTNTWPGRVPKQLRDMRVTDNRRLGSRYALLTLHTADSKPLPPALPGQFVQVSAGQPDGTLLRRPISINDCVPQAGMMQLLVADAGRVTRNLVNAGVGDIVNILTPLGQSWPQDIESGTRVVLCGGGVGIAPIFFYGKWLSERGIIPEFVLAARTASDLLLLDRFREIGTVHICTDDGSMGTKGFAHQSPALAAGTGKRQLWCVCGPAPMMKAIARVARASGVECYVSLENMMACGLGACLCCVEKTVSGNVCVCTNGPVFNIEDLTWE